MSGPPRVRSMNHSDSDLRPILGPALNKSLSLKPASKPNPKPKPNPQCQPEKKSVEKRANLSMEASCSSEASSESSLKSRSSSRSFGRRRESRSVRSGGEVESEVKEMKRCAWVTANTEPAYVEFHDEEWGVPVHDDRKLFELLSLCTALAELPWPIILNRRKSFREVFQDFDPVAVSKLNDKKITTAGSPASSLLSELKLRAIIENARQICKIVGELGSFDKYIWGFVNYKPMVGHFRYPRQVPIKTSKADAISKDLVRRGFRGVGPTVVYSFMQVSGMTNDHLISCFRFQYCVATSDLVDSKDGLQIIKDKQTEDAAGLGLAGAIGDLSLCT